MEAAEYLPEVLPLQLGGMKTHPGTERHAQVAFLQDMLQFVFFWVFFWFFFFILV